MSSCLLPLLIAVFGGFMFFGISQTDVSSPPEPAVVEESVVEAPATSEVAVSTPASANTEAYILAAAAGDIETARLYVCDSNAEELLDGISEDSVIDIEGLICSDEGDNIVKCTFNSDLGILDELTEVEMTFTVDENSLVCELLEIDSNLDDLPSE